MRLSAASVKGRVALALVVALMLVAACAPRSEIRRTEQIQDIIPPTFEVIAGQTSIERFDPPGAGGGLEMVVGTLATNPNQFGITLEAISYEVFLEDRSVVRGGLAPAVFLEAGATVPIRFDIAAELSGRTDLLRAAARSFADRPLRFRIEGTLRFSSASYAFETRSRELVQGATLARQTVQGPILRLDETESSVYLLRPDVPVVQLVLQATNPGDIGYFLHGKELQLTLANWPLAKEDMRPVPMAAGQSTRIDIIFYPQVSDLSPEARVALDAALAGNATLLRLTGELFMDVLGVDSFQVPDGWFVTGFVY